MTIVLVCLGAALGAPARFLTDQAVQARFGTRFPWGTFTVNVVGSLLLGALLGAAEHLAVPPALVAGVGTGFCGALTTYSTFGGETVALARRGDRWPAAGNVVLSVAGSLAAASAGFVLGRAL